jgi:hypothetical protein
LEWAAKRVLENPEWHLDANMKRNVLNVLYGEQNYTGNWHYNAFTPSRLKKMLEYRGFTEFELDDTQGYNIVCRAWRRGAPKVNKKLTAKKMRAKSKRK